MWNEKYICNKRNFMQLLKVCNIQINLPYKVLPKLQN